MYLKRCGNPRHLNFCHLLSRSTRLSDKTIVNVKNEVKGNKFVHMFEGKVEQVQNELPANFKGCSGTTNVSLVHGLPDKQAVGLLPRTKQKYFHPFQPAAAIQSNTSRLQYFISEEETSILSRNKEGQSGK